MLCLTGSAGHFLMVKALEVAANCCNHSPISASPSSRYRLFRVGDAVTPAMLAGNAIITGAGLFTFWRRVAAGRG